MKIQHFLTCDLSDISKQMLFQTDYVWQLYVEHMERTAALVSCGGSCSKAYNYLMCTSERPATNTTLAGCPGSNWTKCKCCCGAELVAGDGKSIKVYHRLSQYVSPFGLILLFPIGICETKPHILWRPILQYMNIHIRNRSVLICQIFGRKLEIWFWILNMFWRNVTLRWLPSREIVRRAVALSCLKHPTPSRLSHNTFRRNV